MRHPCVTPPGDYLPILRITHDNTNIWIMSKTRALLPASILEPPSLPTLTAIPAPPSLLHLNYPDYLATLVNPTPSMPSPVGLGPDLEQDILDLGFGYS